MAIKMIVSDLDGTLLDGAYRLSAENRAALQKAAARGVLVMLATGRMFCSAARYARELGLDSPVISYNGALVQTMDGAVLASAFLPPEVVTKTLRYIFSRGWYVQLYTAEGLFYAAETEAARVYRSASGVAGAAVGEGGLLARTEGVPKLLVVAENPAQTAPVIGELTRALSGEVDVMASNPTYIEIVRPGVSKAAAMLAIAENRGIKTAEIMAMGDSGNDVAMLRAAGLGVAMGNASPAVREAADAVTARVEENGAALAVRRYVLGEKG